MANVSLNGVVSQSLYRSTIQVVSILYTKAPFRRSGTQANFGDKQKITIRCFPVGFCTGAISRHKFIGGINGKCFVVGAAFTIVSSHYQFPGIHFYAQSIIHPFGLGSHTLQKSGSRSCSIANSCIGHRVYKTHHTNGRQDTQDGYHNQHFYQRKAAGSFLSIRSHISPICTKNPFRGSNYK